MKPHRVLVVHNRYLHHGGEDVVVDEEVRLLREHGQVVRLYDRDNAAIAAMPRTTLARETIWSSRTTTEMDRLLDDFAPDLIHVHNSFPLVSPSLYWAAARKHCPVVQTLHNFRLMCLQAMFLRNDRPCEDCKGNLPWRGVLRRCYHDSPAQSAVLATMLGVHWQLGTFQRKVTRYIALNRFSRDKFIEGGLPAERIVVKPNFLRPLPDCNDTARSGALFVGRLSAEKGLGLLAQALDALPDLCVTIIGDGPERPRVDAHPRMNALGWLDRSEVLQRMRQASFLVAPSIWYETFGLVPMEALACGLPVIAPRLGSMAEMIEHGRTGLLFEPGSVSGLAATIAWARLHPEQMAEMGRNARAEYLQRYTPENNYRQLIAIYERAIDDAVNAQG